MVLKAIKEAEKTALPPKYSGECFLNVKKKSYPTVQSAYGGDFQERSEKKKKIPQFNLSEVSQSCKKKNLLTSSSSLSSVVGRTLG